MEIVREPRRAVRENGGEHRTEEQSSKRHHRIVFFFVRLKRSGVGESAEAAGAAVLRSEKYGEALPSFSETTEVGITDVGEVFSRAIGLRMSLTAPSCARHGQVTSWP